MLIGNCSCSAISLLLQKYFIFDSKNKIDNNNDEVKIKDLSKRWQSKPLNVTTWSYFFGMIFMLITSTIVSLLDPTQLNIMPADLKPCYPLSNSTVSEKFCNNHSGIYYNDTIKLVCNCKGIDYETLLIPLFYAAFISSAMAYGLTTVAIRYLPSTVVTAFWPLQGE